MPRTHMLRTLALLSLTLHLAPAARADIKPPGHAGLLHELAFEGLEANPEFDFYLIPPPGWDDSRPPIALSEGAGVSSLYHLLTYELAAVPAGFDGELPTGEPSEADAGGEQPAGASWSARSERSFEVDNTVSQLSKVRSRKTIYRVTGIADGVIQVEHTRTEERDADGELLADALTSEDGSGDGPSMNWMLVYGAIALLSVAGLALAFLRRG